jgi:N-sulfoglucosamine sulfohydrolase
MTMTRRSALTATAGLFASCGGAKRPNVLLVVADDWSFPHAGVYGDPFVRTPHFDRVARDGVKFTNSFACSPSCTPSRSALLTGRHQWQCGEAGVLYGSLPPGLPIVTHALEDAGYRTGFTGKGWLPGDWKALGLDRHPNGQEFNARKHAGPVAPGIDTRDYAANFAEFLDHTDPAKPFFFWLGSTEPHRVYDAEAYRRLDRGLDLVPVPPFLPDTEATRKDLAAYYSEIEWHDRQIGKAMALLGERQILDNTLVLLTSDNGMPFPRAKVNLYDAGLRMPLAMHWPARLQGGVTSHALVSHTDITETITDAAGIPGLPGSTGNSLLRKPEREHVLAGMERHVYARPGGAAYPMRSIRTRDYLYIRNFAPERWPTGGDFLSSNKTPHGDIDATPMLEDLQRDKARWDLAAGKRPAEELYATQSDSWQMKNLAQDPEYAAEKARLAGILEKELRAGGDPRIEGKDPWQSYPYRQTTGFGASFNSTLSEEARDAARDLARHKPE